VSARFQSVRSTRRALERLADYWVSRATLPSRHSITLTAISVPGHRVVARALAKV
jgi:hypothetical protein